MNLKQLLTKLSRIFGQAARKAGGGRGEGVLGTSGPARAKQSPQQRQREKASREAVKRARQAARLTKRMR